MYCQDIGMEFGIEKFTLIIMKIGKQHMTEEIELPNQEKIWNLGEKETHKYKGILEADTIKQMEMKEKENLKSIFQNEKATRYQTRWREDYKRDKYLGCPLRIILEKIPEVDQRWSQANGPVIRKLITMHEDLHPWGDVDSLDVSRKEGGKRLASTEDSVDASTQWLEVYREKRGGRPITATRTTFDIIIKSCHKHGYPWPSVATSPYRSSPQTGLQGYIPYPHIAAGCMFEWVILLLPGDMWGSIGEHHAWARPCFSSRDQHVWVV